MSERISRRGFLKACGLVAGAAILGPDVVKKGIEISNELALRANLETVVDQDGQVWVSEKGPARKYVFPLNKGLLFDRAATFSDRSDASQFGLTTMKGHLGYAHGDTPGSKIDGFDQKPDPRRPDKVAETQYFVQTPLDFDPRNPGRKIEGKG